MTDETRLDGTPQYVAVPVRIMNRIGNIATGAGCGRMILDHKHDEQTCGSERIALASELNPTPFHLCEPCLVRVALSYILNEWQTDMRSEMIETKGAVN